MTKNPLHTGSNLNENEIQENYDYFINFLTENFSGDRRDALLHMYSENELGLSLATAPASSKLNFHYAWQGGYLQHVLHVEKAARGVEKLYAAIGGHIDFTPEERIFAVLHHDLGKLGDVKSGPLYIPNTSEWHIKNLGQIYKFNDQLQYMTVPDRALFLLQQYEIKTTWKEMLGIKLADGLYDDATKEYYKGGHADKDLKTNLPYIMHAADNLSCRAEHDEWKASNEGETGVTI
jgi:hypothetical protein